MYCCLTSLYVYRQINSYQPPSGYLSITRSASGGSERDLRRQQVQGVPEACKKAGFAPTGAVCRSCTTMPVSIRAPPTRRENRNGFPGSRTRRRHLAGRVPRAKRLGRRRRNPSSRNLHTALKKQQIKTEIFKQSFILIEYPFPFYHGFVLSVAVWRMFVDSPMKRLSPSA